MAATEISIEPLAANNEKDWDALVRISDNGHLMAQTGFFGYHADRFEDASLFFKRGRRPLGVLPANRVGDTLWSHQGVSFGGLILHPRTHFSHVGMAVEELMRYLRQAGIKKFMYRPAPFPYHRFPREEDVYFLEQAGARRLEPKLHSMVLCGGPCVQSKTWSKTVRCAAEELTVREGGDADLRAIWELVEQRLAFHGQVAVHSLDEVLLLRSRFPDGLPLLVAEHDGERVAGQLFIRGGNALTSLYLGDSDRGRELKAITLFHEHALRAPQNAGWWIDLGQWCDTDSRESSDSLLQFKEATGGRLIQRHTWQLDL